MPASFVQAASGISVGSAAATANLANTPSPGNLLVFGVYCGGTIASSPSGSTQQAPIGGIENTNSSTYLYLYTRVVETGDGTSWSATGSVSNGTAIAVAEFTGQAASFLNISVGQYNSTSSTSAATAAITPSLSQCLIVSLFGLQGDQSWAAGGSFTNKALDGNTNHTIVMDVLLTPQATPASISETGTIGSSERSVSIILALSPLYTNISSASDTIAASTDSLSRVVTMQRSNLDPFATYTDSASRPAMTSLRAGCDIFSDVMFYPGPWLLNGPGIESQFAASDPNAIAFFSQPGLVVFYPIDYTPGIPPPFPTANIVWWRKYAAYGGTNSGFAYDAAHDLVSSIATGGNTAAVVAYDNERWNATPTDEWSSGGEVPDFNTMFGYMKDFCDTAFDYGFEVVCMPAEDMMDALVPGTYPDKYTAMIAFGIAGAIAPYCTYYHIQAQDLQSTNLDGTPPSFTSYVTAIFGQIRAASSSCIVTVGLTGYPGAQAADIVNAILATFGAFGTAIPGYWLNLPGPESSVASAALAALNAATGAGRSGTISDAAGRSLSSPRGATDSIAAVDG